MCKDRCVGDFSKSIKKLSRFVLGGSYLQLNRPEKIIGNDVSFRVTNGFLIYNSTLQLMSSFPKQKSKFHCVAPLKLGLCRHTSQPFKSARVCSLPLEVELGKMSHSVSQISIQKKVYDGHVQCSDSEEDEQFDFGIFDKLMTL